MLVPVYGFVRGDTIGLVVLVHDHQTVAELAQILQEAASVRVAPWPGPRVFAGGKQLDPALTVAAAGLAALDRVDLLPPYREGE